MSHPHAAHAVRTDIACRNCGTAAPLNFCPACGQETVLHPPTLREFIHEFIGHYVALEGALWRTLALLVLRPGRLTREYLAGLRRRFVLPLRLYLTASFLFFLALKLLPSAVDHAININSRGAAEVAAEMMPAASPVADGKRVSTRPVDCGRADERPCGPIERATNRVVGHFRDATHGSSERLRAQLMGAAPYTIFLLLPVFAGIVMLAYRSRRMTYGEHVVFALHLHTFWFIALLPIALLPDGWSDLFGWVVLIYGTLAIRETYGGGWIWTMLRALFITTLYSAVLVVTTLGLVIGLLAMA